MNILAASCIHNDVENLLVLMDKLSQIDFDVIVFPGDFTDASLPKGFTRVDIAKLILSEFQNFGKPVVTVPGTWDKEIIEFLDKSETSVHGKGRVIDGVGFYGFGGARTPFNTPYEPSDAEIESGLRNAYESVKEAITLVQVTHAPPIDTGVDVAFSGAHVGSPAVRKMIEKVRPAAAICAHIHEAKGIDLINDTKVVNAGRFPEGSCALVNITGHVCSAKMLNLI